MRRIAAFACLFKYRRFSRMQDAKVCTKSSQADIATFRASVCCKSLVWIFFFCISDTVSRSLFLFVCLFVTFSATVQVTLLSLARLERSRTPKRHTCESRLHLLDSECMMDISAAVETIY